MKVFSTSDQDLSQSPHCAASIPQLGLHTMLQGFSTSDATALCTFAYSSGPGAEPIIFEGRTEGRIVPARGSKHFGWDPIFEIEDTGLT